MMSVHGVAGQPGRVALCDADVAGGSRSNASALGCPCRNRYLLSMAGSPYKMTVRSEELERLSRHMPVKVPPDLSKQLATPMPGKLHSIAVKGDARNAPAGCVCCRHVFFPWKCAHLSEVVC